MQTASLHGELEIDSPRYIFGSFLEPLFLNKVAKRASPHASGIEKLVHRSVKISVIICRNSAELQAYLITSGGYHLRLSRF